jgi:hypothetical protein
MKKGSDREKLDEEQDAAGHHYEDHQGRDRAANGQPELWESAHPERSTAGLTGNDILALAGIRHLAVFLH